MGGQNQERDSNTTPKRAGKPYPPAKKKKQHKTPNPAEQVKPDFPIAGIGASAGGLEAFSMLLENLPNNTGMAFVFVQHLAPGHTSMLTELLARKTSMPVSEIRDGMVIQPNKIYVIPPALNLGIMHGRLHLLTPPEKGSPHLPIDYFFQSLAQDQGNRAIGVVLSGSASDGTLGLKAIKAQGGITFAQDEVSATYSSMPHSAIMAGHVDFVLPPKSIAAELARLAQQPYIRHVQIEEQVSKDSLDKIFLLLRKHTGHDFSGYKRSTIDRRIKRRMALHKIDDLDHYVHYLEKSPNEVKQLFQDILINVTAFFRDPETFEALKEYLFPKLMEKRPPEEPLRIWVPGCSTGEEAFSIAIVLTEFLADRPSNISVQIFASDIDETAIQKARIGIYSENDIAGILPERLQRFFIKTASGFQINKMIRDMCIFALQDVIKDPPFSHLDLVCCRNLLIYLGSTLQKKVLTIFHYSLKPSGYLMLGTSETIGSAVDLFALKDKKGKVYIKKSIPTPRFYELGPPISYETTTHVQPYRTEKMADKLHAEAEQLILNSYSPPGVIINEEMEILGFTGRVGPFIEPSSGTANLKLLKMVHPDLLIPLRAAVSEAIKNKTSIKRERMKFHHNDKMQYLNIIVTPLTAASEIRTYLVLFEAALAAEKLFEASAKEPTGPGFQDTELRITELEHELQTTREQMQFIINEQVTVNEELQTANEENQSSNEELQSTNEELESAKEELQSTNEELATVNEEMETRNTELEQVNDDLTNLLNSVHLPIVMLNEKLCIRHFTPMARQLLNLIDTDIGRPLRHIKANIDIPNLDGIVTDVIDSVTGKSMETKDNEGHWYSLQIRPYKTSNNRIAGAVLIFIDITDIKSDPQQARRLAAIVRDSNDAITLSDGDGRILAWNHGAHRMYGYTEAEALNMNILNFTSVEFYNEIKTLLDELKKGGDHISIETKRTSKDGRLLDVWLTFSVLRDGTGNVSAIATTERDITDMKRRLEQANRLAAVVHDSSDAIILWDMDGKVRAWNPRAQQLYGYHEDEAIGMSFDKLVPKEHLSEYHTLLERLKRGEHLAPFCTWRNCKDGRTLEILLTLSTLVDEQGRPTAFVTT